MKTEQEIRDRIKALRGEVEHYEETLKHYQREFESRVKNVDIHNLNSLEDLMEKIEREVRGERKYTLIIDQLQCVLGQ